MHPLLLNSLVEKCRSYIDQGDAGTCMIRTMNQEQLVHAIVQQADEIDRLQTLLKLKPQFTGTMCSSPVIPQLDDGHSPTVSRL